MNTLQNLHTHTKYCDGKDTVEEVILEACEKGFGAIGFSGHCYCFSEHSSESYSPFSMSLEGTNKYRKEIASLKEKYAGRIEVYCGLEVDMYSGIDLSGYDYLIGSVHYLMKDGNLIGMDRSAEEVRKIIETHFSGDGMEYAKTYYAELAKLPEYGDFDIIGHFDLLTKHKEKECFFDTNTKEYQYLAIEAAEKLAGRIPFFEVNTGAIARGYRTTPYPETFLLKELKRLGFGAVISSDCHERAKLDCEFKQAVDLLRSCGFQEKYILTEEGFKAVEL